LIGVIARDNSGGPSGDLNDIGVGHARSLEGGVLVDEGMFSLPEINII
jgi:hypothetical protein